jgi:hypothetical protein
MVIVIGPVGAGPDGVGDPPPQLASATTTAAPVTRERMGRAPFNITHAAGQPSCREEEVCSAVFCWLPLRIDVNSYVIRRRIGNRGPGEGGCLIVDDFHFEGNGEFGVKYFITG